MYTCVDCGRRAQRNLGLERLDQRGPLAVQLLPPEHHAAIHTLAVFVEDGFWRRRALLHRNVAHAIVGKPQPDGP
jgi:hypothetical protein